MSNPTPSLQSEPESTNRETSGSEGERETVDHWHRESCGICGQGAHRYGTTDPEHQYNAMGCVNMLLPLVESLRLAGQEGDGEIEALRAEVFRLGQALTHQDAAPLIALEWIALFTCDDPHPASCLDRHPEQFDQWCQSCIAVAALAALNSTPDQK